MKEKFVSILIILAFCINGYSQNISNKSSVFKSYTIGSYQINYAKGAKLSWEKAFDLADKFAEDDNINWRLPSIDELKEIYNYKKILGITSGEFWSSTIQNQRVGLIHYIDFSNGRENGENGGNRFYFLIKHKSN